MNALFRHFTVRLWVTALCGGLLCILLLPHYQRIMGLDGLWIPALTVMLGCFAAAGFVMNRLGMLSIRRHIAEAAVWERAGLNNEAEAAFERAKSLYDGFWLSPLQRRRSADWIIMRLARFCVIQPVLGTTGHAVVTAYLQIHPGDADMALGWLEKILQQESHAQEEHETAALINDALPEHTRVQRLLMQFYLSSDRSDFEAMQTYRRVWQTNDLAPSLIRDLARLLLRENLVNDWALQVYLKGYSLGDAGCLEGIAASLRQSRPDTETSEDLAMAGSILAGLDEIHRRNYVEPAPAIERIEDEPLPYRTAARAAPGLGVRLAQGWGVARRGLNLFFRRVRASANRRLTAVLRQGRAQSYGRLGRFTAIGILLGILAIAAAVGWRAVNLQFVPARSREHTVAAPTTRMIDPFTIQVAAYLKPEDARSLVERLKKQKIDAFSTKATSGNRTWYQVKISHFPTRDEARTYGEGLKAKGLIDDFYVANYTP